jgi:protein-S-isoprenylcysteine O-methyltransferase Ste14
MPREASFAGERSAMRDTLNRPLAHRVVVGQARLFAVVAAILVLSAWSFSYWQGWAFLINLATCTAALTAYCAYRDPALLERRMRAGPTAERDPAQKIIQTVNAAAVTGLVIVPGLDHRWGWSHVPVALVVAGHLMMVGGFLGWLLVFRENSFAASTIEVAAGQRVIDTGPYALVRHPMYSVSLPLFVGVPLALGSYWALLLSLVVMAGIVARLLYEERYLDANLPGYTAYRLRVRWRLAPGIW